VAYMMCMLAHSTHAALRERRHWWQATEGSHQWRKGGDRQGKAATGKAAMGEVVTDAHMCLVCDCMRADRECVCMEHHEGATRW